jgi:DNA mismatch endonuclease (patch repair protein)
MTDFLTPKQRSIRMARIRSTNTTPELVLRRGLHRLGFRFRLNDNKLPGCPDIVLRRYGAIVFIHGCFWHHHRGCSIANNPKSNQIFWQKKFAANVARDTRVRRLLRNRGWRVFVVWECEVSTARRAIRTIERLGNRISR